MKETLGRRDFLKMGGAVLAASTAGCAAGVSGSAVAASGSKAPMISTHDYIGLPKAKGPRLVIVGAGTSGMTVAAHAKKDYPKWDVVLVDKRDMYSSCFMSSLWEAGMINMEFIAAHSFLNAANNYGYNFVCATATGLDRHAKKLYTSNGAIAYDFLLLAPGISYDFAKIGVTEPENVYAVRQKYPGGFISPMEHVAIRDKFQNFDGGVFIQNVPSGNYRCLPGPYERACLMADWIKKNKIAGKVIILDANPEVTITAKGFHYAFDHFFKGILEWKPNHAITGVDTDKKVINTEFDSYPFDDACIYPNVRGNTVIEQLGVMAPSTKSNQMEADNDVRFYNIMGDPYVYASGDCRSQPYSKSANTSNSEGHLVAKILAARVQGKEIKWYSPETLCYSAVGIDPPKTIKVDTYYGYDPKKDAITGFKDTRSWDNPSVPMWHAYLAWGNAMYRDMFGQ